MVSRALVGLTVLALALTLAACGTPSQQASSPAQARAAYATCIRDHGVPDFPNPDANGSFTYRGASSPGLAAAMRACSHFLDSSAGSSSSSQQLAQMRQQAYRWTLCMRQHGINVPDPDPAGPGVNLTGLDISSPAFRSANKACGSLVQGVMTWSSSQP